MSWQGKVSSILIFCHCLIHLLDYIDNQLLVNPKIQKAAILGQEGGVWASSKDYTVWHRFNNRIPAAFLTFPVSWSNGVAQR